MGDLSPTVNVVIRQTEGVTVKQAWRISRAGPARVMIICEIRGICRNSSDSAEIFIYRRPLYIRRRELCIISRNMRSAAPRERRRFCRIRAVVMLQVAPGTGKGFGVKLTSRGDCRYCRTKETRESVEGSGVDREVGYGGRVIG